MGLITTITSFTAFIFVLYSKNIRPKTRKRKNEKKKAENLRKSFKNNLFHKIVYPNYLKYSLNLMPNPFQKTDCCYL